jgi:DNA mismatch repair protein MutS2
MDRRSWELLEYPAVRARLAAYAAFGPSRRLVEALEPSADPVVVARGLDETDEARAFLAERPDVGIGGARDIEGAVNRAARGGRLDPMELVSIMDTLVAAGRLGDALRPVERPLLHELGRSISPLPTLRARLETSIDPAGEILDSASPALGGLRRAVRIAYERLRTRLDQLVHGELGGALQEPIITLRNGRYVIPVRADARSRVRGIVHDTSGSGQTLFVEPLIAVELGNAWREAQARVQEEEERILDELSALVAVHADALAETLSALARFDLWAAKARLGEELDAVRPEATKETVITLLSARHPGLSGRVVPIDVRLGGDWTALVITGPNTGGKTVALRTVGLMCLMHQAGLHVPAAAGTRLPVLRDVFADIGDEQSIAQSLSTFSGHLRSIVRIVGAAGPGCLVLLDELGAGTDPTEGSALAQALLDHFVRAGALVVATTHYAELKIYAHETPAARNASVEFDLETLSPTYRLSIGLPGTSQAFAIAERLGLPSGLVSDARSRLSRAQLDFEATLASIKASQQAIEEERARAAQAEARAQEARRSAEEERRRARIEREQAVATARGEAEAALEAVHREIAAARELLGRHTLTEARLDEMMARLDARLAALPAGATAPPPVARGEWRVGQRALAPAGWAGTIAAIDGHRGRATLEAGGVRVEVPLADLMPTAAHGAVGPGPGPAGGAARPVSGRRGEFGAEPRVRTPASASGRRAAERSGGMAARAIPSSLDLRGARVEEAIELLDRYLDSASTAGAGRLTVIHGHGSGALRDAVRQRLVGHPLVREWRPGERGEGGDGATVVTL